MTDVTLPDPSKSDKAIDDIRTQTAEALPQEIFNQYINFLSDKYKVQVNSRVLQSLYGVEPASN